MFKIYSTAMRIISCLLVLVILQGTLVIAQETVEEAEDTPMLIIGTFGAWLREAPSREAETITSLERGQVPILILNNDTDFYLVSVDGIIGWVNGKTTVQEGDLSLVPTLDLDTVADIPIFIPDSEVTLYNTTDEDAEIIAETEGEDLYILALREEEDFYLVVYQGRTAWLATEALSDNGEIEGELDAVPILSDTPEPCFVSTEQAQTVRLRVGYGENRTSVTFLAADTEFEVLGQNVDDGETIWYALNKEEAASGKSINGDVVWLIATDVEAAGDCEAVPTMDASGVIPIAAAPTTNETPSDGNTTGETVSTTVSVSPAIRWTNTNVTLTAGQSFTIQASGSVNTCTQCGEDYSTPAGSGYSCGNVADDPNASLCPMIGVDYGALVARIGNGSAFYVGGGGTFTANADGILQFSVNDSTLDDNVGSYTVVVTSG